MQDLQSYVLNNNTVFHKNNHHILVLNIVIFEYYVLQIICSVVAVDVRSMILHAVCICSLKPHGNYTLSKL